MKLFDTKILVLHFPKDAAPRFLSEKVICDFWVTWERISLKLMSDGTIERFGFRHVISEAILRKLVLLVNSAFFLVLVW